MMKAIIQTIGIKIIAKRAVALLQIALLLWPNFEPLYAEETLVGHHVKVSPVNPHQIKPNPVGKTETIKTRGHAPTVNIQTPNAKGLSMNLVETFHVKEWTHLNNCHTRDCLSQRGERVLGNPHLAHSGPARLVVMEVTGRQRSQLHDRLEMVGRTADFVLVNPNGIHAGGAGFVNMPRVTLSTGKPLFDADQQLLKGLDVSRGRIVIGKEGLALNGVKALDLIARKVEFRGKIAEHLTPKEKPRLATTDVCVSAGITGV